MISRNDTIPFREMQRLFCNMCWPEVRYSGEIAQFDSGSSNLSERAVRFFLVGPGGEAAPSPFYTPLCRALLSSREQQLCSSTSVTSRNLYLDQNFAATTVASGDIIARQTRQILRGKNLQNDVDQSISSISSHPQLSNCTKKFF